MNILKALSVQHAELADLLRRLSAGDWSRETRCAGWNVGDVVLHLAQTDEMAVASLDDRVEGFMDAKLAGESGATTIDDGAAMMVARERGLTPAALFDRWCAASGELEGKLLEADEHRRVRWVAGELSVRTLAVTRLAECWIHTGDIADAVGVELVPDDRLEHVARLAWRTLPYAFAREGKELAGPVAFELTGPDGNRWGFELAEAPATTVRGDGVELCMVAARRVDPSQTGLVAEGPDARDVLSLVRTYA